MNMLLLTAKQQHGRVKTRGARSSPCVPHVAEYRHGRWCDSDGMMPDLEDRSLKITHWMPMPEPPEMKEETP